MPALLWEVVWFTIYRQQKYRFKIVRFLQHGVMLKSHKPGFLTQAMSKLNSHEKLIIDLKVKNIGWFYYECAHCGVYGIDLGE